MNSYITAQIMNMKAMCRTFEQSCNFAALQDDGKVSKEEEQTLRRISEATKKFIAELDKLQ